MSTAHHHAPAAAAHDASDHHDFDGEPARALPADEPPTPGWVPALGLALFATAGIALLAMSSGDEPAEPRDTRPAAAVQAAPAARPQPSPADTPKAAADAKAAAPAGAASDRPNLRRMSPEELQQIRQRVMEARQKNGAQGQKGAAEGQPAPQK